MTQDLEVQEASPATTPKRSPRGSARKAGAAQKTASPELSSGAALETTPGSIGNSAVESAPKAPRKRMSKSAAKAESTPNTLEEAAPKPARTTTRTTRNPKATTKSVPPAVDNSSGSAAVSPSISQDAEFPELPSDSVGNRVSPIPAAKRGTGRKRGTKAASFSAEESSVLFQPEAFADIYPSAAENSPPFQLALPDLDEDGPQPALPGQPSLALPPGGELTEEELAALDELDEQVNGNKVEGSGSSSQDRKGRDKRSDTRPDGRADTRSDRRQQRQSSKNEQKQQHRQEVSAPSLEHEAVAPEVEKQPQVAPTKRVLYVSEIPDEQVEVVITDNGQVTEYFVEMAHQAKIRGNIYKGIINNVDTNLQAAFVNFGGGKNGFLQIDEVHPEYWLIPHDSSRGPKYPPIQKALKVGQEVLVQVVKEPAGSKGAFLTSWISLAGRFLVLTPGQEQIGVSRKVEDTQERNRLKELLNGIQPGEDLGVIIRTASEGASKTSIQKDLQYLKRLWKDLRKKAISEKAPGLIYQEADLASRAVRDYLAEDIYEIWVDNPNTRESISETTNLLFPRSTDIVKLHQDPRHTLWERFNLQRQLEEVTSREVVLPSGGRLVFDQTEALMAIDINSGKTQGKSSFEDMVFRTNMEAAEAIARHLRLRDIGGQVVIDFIEMRDRNHCREVEKCMRNAMRLDRARHDVGRMSSFGLLELVRQRTGTSAISISSEPCPHCRGTGVRRNMEWQAMQALRDLQAKLVKAVQSGQNKNKNKYGDSLPTSFQFETNAELGLYLLNKKRDRLCDLEDQHGLHIEVVLK